MRPAFIRWRGGWLVFVRLWFWCGWLVVAFARLWCEASICSLAWWMVGVCSPLVLVWLVGGGVCSPVVAPCLLAG